VHGLWHDLWAPAIAATVGTAAGAALAFWIDRHNRAARVEDERVTATNTAIFALIRICNDLDVYRRQEIEAQRNSAARWYTLRPTPLPAPVPFDTTTLAYLFELANAQSLPMEVDLELGRYASIHETATERNRIHEAEAHPAIERAQLTVEGALGLPLTELVGPRIFETLRGLTDDLINMTDLSLASIPVTARKLHDVAVAEYPKRRIIWFERLQPVTPEYREPA
jgi:hypothetical protein